MSDMFELCEIQRKIDVYFHANGQVDFSSRVSKALGMTDGDVINVLSSGTGEYYLYIARHASEISNVNSRYPNCVHPVKSRKRTHNSFRCNSVKLCRKICFICNAQEAWLYVGAPKDLSCYGIPCIGLPLIYSNNQYNKK